MKRILTNLVLIFFIFSSTTVVYASVKKDDVVLDELSDLYIANEVLRSDSNATLIPEGAIQGVNDVYYIEYEYELIVKEGTNVYSDVRDVFMRTSDIDEETLMEVFNFEFTTEVIETLDYTEHLFGETIEANRVVVTLRISMNEPATYEIFEQIVGGQLQFEVEFFAG